MPGGTMKIRQTMTVTEVHEHLVGDSVHRNVTLRHEPSDQDEGFEGAPVLPQALFTVVDEDIDPGDTVLLEVRKVVAPRTT